MVQRYDVYGTWDNFGNGSTITSPNDSGDWVYYKDHLKEIESLEQKPPKISREQALSIIEALDNYDSSNIYSYIDIENDMIDIVLTIANGDVEVIDCSTCKHRAVSKYVCPCYGCRDNNGYDNYEREE